MSTTIGTKKGTTDAVMERDKFACFRCGASILTRTHVLHERRRGPALGSAANTIILRGSVASECNQKGRANPVLSQKLGYSIPSTADPCVCPCSTTRADSCCSTAPAAGTEHTSAASTAGKTNATNP